MKSGSLLLFLCLCLTLFTGQGFSDEDRVFKNLDHSQNETEFERILQQKDDGTKQEEAVKGKVNEKQNVTRNKEVVFIINKGLDDRNLKELNVGEVNGKAGKIQEDKVTELHKDLKNTKDMRNVTVNVEREVQGFRKDEKTLQKNDKTDLKEVQTDEERKMDKVMEPQGDREKVVSEELDEKNRDGFKNMDKGNNEREKTRNETNSQKTDDINKKLNVDEKTKRTVQKHDDKVTEPQQDVQKVDQNSSEELDGRNEKYERNDHELKKTVRYNGNMRTRDARAESVSEGEAKVENSSRNSSRKHEQDGIKEAEPGGNRTTNLEDYIRNTANDKMADHKTREGVKKDMVSEVEDFQWEKKSNKGLKKEESQEPKDKLDEDQAEEEGEKEKRRSGELQTIQTKTNNVEVDKHEESNVSVDGKRDDLETRQGVKMGTGDFRNEKENFRERSNKKEDGNIQKNMVKIKSPKEKVQKPSEPKPKTIKPRPVRDLDDCQTHGVRVLDDLRTELGSHQEPFRPDQDVDVIEDLHGLQTEDHSIKDLDSVETRLETGLGIGEDLLDLDEAKEPSLDPTRTVVDPEKDPEVQSESSDPVLDPALVPAWVSGLWDELKGLRRLVLVLKARDVDRSQALRTIETRLKDSNEESLTRTQSLWRTIRENEDRLELLQRETTVQFSGLKSEVSEIKSRLNHTQIWTEDLKLNNQALGSELPFLQSRLGATESSLQELKTKSSVFASKLCNTETELQQLKRLSSECLVFNSSEAETRLNRLDELRRQTQDSQQQLSTELDSLQKHLQQKHSSVLTEVSELILRLNSTQSQILDLRSSAAAESGRLESVEEHLEQLQTRNEAQSNRVLSVETQLEQLQLEREADVTEMKEEVTELRRSVSRQSVRLESLETHLEQLQTENKDLQMSVRAGDEELRKKTEAQLSDVSSRLSSAQRLHHELDVRLRLSEQLLQQLQSLSTDVRERLNSTEERLLLVSDTTADLSLRLSRGERLIQDLLNDSSDLTLSLNKTRTELTLLSSAQSADLFALTTTLRMNSEVSQKELKDSTQTLLHKLSELDVRLRLGEQLLKQLQSLTTALTLRLNSTEDRLLLLSDTAADVQKVAFSAGLTDSGAVGPFDSETTLLFTKVLTNDGAAYDRNTGLFLAPVRGLYFFSFSAVDFVKGYMGVYLYHNHRPISFNLALNAHGGYASMCNSVVLRLELGDTVSLRLPASYRLYDDARNFSIFSGFILFTL